MHTTVTTRIIAPQHPISSQVLQAGQREVLLRRGVLDFESSKDQHSRYFIRAVWIGTAVDYDCGHDNDPAVSDRSYQLTQPVPNLAKAVR